MKELIEVGLPVFCSLKCAGEFPYKETKEYDLAIEKLKQKIKEQK